MQARRAMGQFYRAIDEAVVPDNERILVAFRERGMIVSFLRIACTKRDGPDRFLATC